MERTLQEILDELKVTGKVTIKGFGQFYTTIQRGREGVSKLGGVEKAWKTEDKTIIKFYPSKSLDVSDFKVGEE